MDNFDDIKIFIDLFGKSAARRYYNDHRKIKESNLKHWVPLPFNEIRKLVDNYYTYAQNYSWTRISKLLTTEDLYYFNNNFYQRFDKKISIEKLGNIYSIIDEFVEENTPKSKSNINQKRLKNYIKSQILIYFIKLFNAEFAFTKKERVDELKYLREEKQMINKAFHNFINISKKFYSELFNLLKLPSNFKYKSVYKSVYKKYFPNEKLLDSFWTMINKTTSFYNAIKEDLEHRISSESEELGKYSSSVFPLDYYLALIELHLNIKDQIQTSILKYGKICGKLLLEFEIFPEDELTKRRLEQLHNSLPKTKILKTIDIKTILQLYKHEFNESDINNILSENEDIIIQQFAETYKTNYKRYKSFISQ